MLDSATDTPTPSSTHSVSIPPVGKNFVEFFAGIGLVRLGLEQAGWKCVYANDIDSKKEEVYSRNFGDNHFCLQDIWGVDFAIDKPWFNEVNSIIWTTLDSLPILPSAVEKAPKIKNYW